MYLKKLKEFLKKNFPRTSKRFIYLRDNNNFIRSLLKTSIINVNKNIHGKKIVTQPGKILKINNRNNFISYTIRPKYADDTFPNFSIKKSDNNDHAIIIQGPIKNYEKFVIETLKLYNKIFSNITIILSTWDDEISQDFIIKIKSFNNLKLIKNKKINFLENIDLQILSTNNALKLAKTLGLKYVLKTRTDCRVYNKNSFLFLENLMKTFPITNNNNFKHRILASSMDTRTYRIYGLTDICLFGSIEDFLIYFDETNYIDSLKDISVDFKKPIINDTAIINEIFLCARYLKNKNVKLQWTLEDWWLQCRNLFCIFDHQSLDLFWYKYHWEFEQRFTRNYSTDYNQCMSFATWLSIFNNKIDTLDQSNQERWTLTDGLVTKKN